jgi:ArsR family transcriptional regulator, arsenate/arsenite/antimonite-responsive transcriptional repressor
MTRRPDTLATVDGSRIVDVSTDVNLFSEAAVPEPCCPSLLASPLTEPEADDLAQVFAALADPVRLRILSLVAEAGEVCSCNLLEPLGRSQPTISHHTKVLADAGLIVGEKRGRWVWWTIVPDRVDSVRAALAPVAAPA